MLVLKLHERAMNLVAIVRTFIPEVPNDEAGILDALLEVADSSMTYRSRYFTAPQLPGVLDLLLKDKTNPRSVAFQLAALHDHVEKLPRDPSCPLPSREQSRESNGPRSSSVGNIEDPATSKRKPGGRYRTPKCDELTNDHVTPSRNMKFKFWM